MSSSALVACCRAEVEIGQIRAGRDSPEAQCQELDSRLGCSLSPSCQASFGANRLLSSARRGLQANLRAMNQTCLNMLGKDLSFFIPEKQLKLGEPLTLSPTNAKLRPLLKGAPLAAMRWLSSVALALEHYVSQRLCPKHCDSGLGGRRREVRHQGVARAKHKLPGVLSAGRLPRVLE